MPTETELKKCPGCSNLQQRKDDKEEVVQRRLELYQTATAPLIRYYLNRVREDKSIGKCIHPQGMLLTFEVRRGVEDFDSFERLLKEGGRERKLF